MNLFFQTAAQKERAIKIGLKFGFSVHRSPWKDKDLLEDLGDDCFLMLSAERLSLCFADNSHTPFSIDFLSKKLQYRAQHCSIKNEALARAIGVKRNKRPIVFDLTAGIGRDSFILATLGCPVYLFERQPVVAALLHDAIQRSQASGSSTSNRMVLHFGNAAEILNKLATKIGAEIIYLDPMFPQRSKSALVKKEMQILQRLAGYDHDSAELLTLALSYARQRVVCKRPKHAKPIQGKPPTMTVTSKNHRFDIYLIDKK